MQSYSFEDYLSIFEIACTGMAMVPVVGSIPAVIKIMVGVVQTIVGVVATIFIGIPALLICQDGKTLCRRIAAHIIHGPANILAGSFEIIPVVSFISALLRIRWLRGSSSHFINYKFGPVMLGEIDRIRANRVAHQQPIGGCFKPLII